MLISPAISRHITPPLRRAPLRSSRFTARRGTRERGRVAIRRGLNLRATPRPVIAPDIEAVGSAAFHHGRSVPEANSVVRPRCARRRKSAWWASPAAQQPCALQLIAADNDQRSTARTTDAPAHTHADSTFESQMPLITQGRAVLLPFMYLPVAATEAFLRTHRRGHLLRLCHHSSGASGEKEAIRADQAGDKQIDLPAEPYSAPGWDKRSAHEKTAFAGGPGRSCPVNGSSLLSGRPIPSAVTATHFCQLLQAAIVTDHLFPPPTSPSAQAPHPPGVAPRRICESAMEIVLDSF